MIMEELSQKSFDSVLLKFLLDEPFFATIIRAMRKVRSEDLPTAGVNYEKGTMTLYWNPKFMHSLSTKKKFGLLKHECYHLIRKHVTSRKQKPHLDWNIATDLAINSDIPLDELPECGLIPGRKNTLTVEDKEKLTEDRVKSIEKFSNFIESMPPKKSSEWYMERIQENKEIKDIIEDLYGNKVVAILDEHDESELSESEQALAEQQVKTILKNAKEVANNRGWGSVSHSTRQEIEKATQAEYDPKRAIKYFCGMKMRSGYFKTQRKINRKYPYIHAGKKSKKTSSLAVYIDQSGSVGGTALTMFQGWLAELSKTHTFTFYYFDSRVEDDSKTVWKKGKTADFRRSLTGGTCFDAVEDHFRKVKKDFDGCIIMTDGYAPKPKSCTSKRCWVICPNGSLQFTPDRKDYVIKMNKGYS